MHQLGIEGRRHANRLRINGIAPLAHTVTCLAPPVVAGDVQSVHRDGFVHHQSHFLLGREHREQVFDTLLGLEVGVAVGVDIFAGTFIGRVQTPLHLPQERVARLQLGVGTLALQFDVGISLMHIDLYLGLVGCWLLGRQVLETFGEYQVVVDVRQPTLAVGIDLSVLALHMVDVILRQSGSVAAEVHLARWRNLLNISVKEDASLGQDTGNLPRCHLARCGGLVLEHIGHQEPLVLGIDLKTFDNAQRQFLGQR